MHAYTALAFVSIALCALAAPVPGAKADVSDARFVSEVSSRSSPAIEILPRARSGTGGVPDILKRFRFGTGGQGRGGRLIEIQTEAVEARGRINTGTGRGRSVDIEAKAVEARGRINTGTGRGRSVEVEAKAVEARGRINTGTGRGRSVDIEAKAVEARGRINSGTGRG